WVPALYSRDACEPAEIGELSAIYSSRECSANKRRLDLAHHSPEECKADREVTAALGSFTREALVVAIDRPALTSGVHDRKGRHGPPARPYHRPVTDLDPRTVRALVRAMPKAELHLHLDGSLRIDTALDIARTRGIDAPRTFGGMRGVLVGPEQG